MSATPKKSENAPTAHTFDAIPEDEEKQDELNRRLRKPGEPAYSPPAKTAEAKSEPEVAAG